MCHQCTRTLLTKCVSCNFGIYRYRYNYENIHNKIVSSPSQRDNGNNNKGSVKRGGPVVGHRAHRQKKVRYNAFTIHFATLNYLQIHLSLRQTIPDTNRTPSTITRAEHEHVLVCVFVLGALFGAGMPGFVLNTFQAWWCVVVLGAHF